MTITLPLQPQEEAGVFAVSDKKEPSLAVRGILPKYGSAPSTEEIDQSRAEIFANFLSDDF